MVAAARKTTTSTTSRSPAKRATGRRPKAGAPPNKQDTPPWVGEWPRLTGRQEPKHEHSFTGDETDGDRCARFGHRITKQRSLPWQWRTMRKILSRRPDYLWTHPDVVLVCTRQQGKTLILVLRILFGLFILGENIAYTAQRGNTSDAVFKRVKAIINSRPSLKNRVVSMTGGKQGFGEIVVRSKLGTEVTVQFGVRSGDKGRGLDRIDLAIFDEAYNLTQDEVSALQGAQVASANSQTIYTSTAPVESEHPNCHVFAGMRRRGLNKDTDLLFIEFAAPDPPKDSVERKVAREDRENWRLAEPSYGVISKERDIERFYKTAVESREASKVALWEADFLGWGEWPADARFIDPVIPIKEVWEPLTDYAPELVGQKVLAVSRTRDLARWAIAVGQRTIEGRVQIEIGYYQKATIGQVAAYVVRLVELWDPATIVIDDHDPAKPLAPYLKKLDVDVTLTTTGQIAVAFQGFVDAAMSGDLGHTNQPILTEGLEVAMTRELPRGDKVWDDREGSIAQVIAATMAHWGVLEFAEEDSPAALPSMGAGNPETTSSHLDVLGAAF